MDSVAFMYTRVFHPITNDPTRAYTSFGALARHSSRVAEKMTYFACDAAWVFYCFLGNSAYFAPFLSKLSGLEFIGRTLSIELNGSIDRILPINILP